MKLKTFLTVAAVVPMMSFAAMPAQAGGGHCPACGGGSPTSFEGVLDAEFEGTVGSSNLAGASGNLTFAATENWKSEMGEAWATKLSDGTNDAGAIVHVATGGTGFASALSGGVNEIIQAESLVQGTLAGTVSASLNKD